MKIATYQPLHTPSPALLELLKEKYERFSHFDYFIHDYRKAFCFCADSEHIAFVPIAAETEKMQAHVALILDKRLPDGEAFFGFLEIPEDVHVSDLLWDHLTREARARGIHTIKGPVNGSIWHQYRCIKQTDHSPFFTSELFCEPHYYHFFVSHAPASEELYYSAYRERFQAILQAGQAAYDRLAGSGFRIEETRVMSPDVLRILASLSEAVFRTSWGFTTLNQKEFSELYSAEKLDTNLSRLYFLHRGSEVIGFCGTLKESDSVLICKTICVLPLYHGMGLGNALAFKVHLDAHEQGVRKIIYALIREGNSIKNFPKDDAVIFRRYAAFEFRL